MDDLISKLRSQVSNTQAPVASQPASSQSDVHVVKNEAELLDPTTSQCDVMVKNRFKLDFDILRKYREEDAMMISDVKECEKFKFDGSIWAIVKSIEVFKGIESNVCKWELIDETGIIFASANVNDQSVTVGAVVCISDFSFWKISGNHLNITERNIKKIIN